MGSGPWGERTCRTFSRVSPARSRSSAPRRLTRRAHRIPVPRSTSTRTAWWSGRGSFPERWSGPSSSHDGGRGTRDEGRVESRQPPSPVPRPAPDRFLLMSNLLASEPSAYLKSAAHQPVHWHPWGDAAFARARAEDKPILLDIGAVWCHWCHVMDGESYEDARVADLLNADFVCIKVDRDERPDVDARYQRAVQALTGQGGWPLTAFLTPEGEVFYGGTYFPPEENHYGRAGFPSVLRQVAGTYRQQRDKVTEHAKAIRDRVAESLDEAQSGDVSPATLERAAAEMARMFDVRYGGVGAAPQIPPPPARPVLPRRLHFVAGRGPRPRERPEGDKVHRARQGDPHPGRGVPGGGQGGRRDPRHARAGGRRDGADVRRPLRRVRRRAQIPPPRGRAVPAGALEFGRGAEP